MDMDGPRTSSRRRLLGSLAAGAAGALAGCAGGGTPAGREGSRTDSWTSVEDHQAALSAAITPPDGAVTVALGFRERADVSFDTRVYEAPAAGTWARVIELELAADADPGTVAAVNWPVKRL